MVIVIVVSSFFCTKLVNAISLSPAKQRLTIDPGAMQVVKIEITNDSDKQKNYLPGVDSFTIDSRTGRAIWQAGDNAMSWVKPINSELKLNKGEKGEFQFAIEVPNGELPMDHYLGLFAKEVSELGQVSVGSRVGSLLFLTVSGQISEKMTLISLVGDSKNVILQLKNESNVFVTPSGMINFYNVTGRYVGSVEINNNNRKVGANDYFEDTIIVDQKLLGKNIGIIKAKAEINYGLSEQKIQSKNHLWIVQSWKIFVEILVFVFGLTILFFIIKFGVKSQKS